MFSSSLFFRLFLILFVYVLCIPRGSIGHLANNIWPKDNSTVCVELWSYAVRDWALLNLMRNFVHFFSVAPAWTLVDAIAVGAQNNASNTEAFHLVFYYYMNFKYCHIRCISSSWTLRCGGASAVRWEGVVLSCSFFLLLMASGYMLWLSLSCRPFPWYYEMLATEMSSFECVCVWFRAPWSCMLLS